MKIKKLNIETHTTNKSNGLNYSKANTATNLKNIKIYKNLFKARLEDRKRIKGIKFSTNKKENNNLCLYKLKKKEEESTFELNEANYLRSLRDYNQLKHEIYLKELKEKKVKTKEALLNEKMVKRDINYTFLKETLYQFMRFKKNHSKYNTNLLKNKDELKRSEKISKSNFINKTIRSVSRRFSQIGGKVDMGIYHREEIVNEKEYDHLIEQISKYRIRHLKSFQGIIPTKDSNLYKRNDSPIFNIFPSRKTQEFTLRNNQFISHFQDNTDSNKIEEDEDEKELLLNLISNSKKSSDKKDEIKNMKSNFICKTDTNINPNINSNKKKLSISGKAINKNIKSSILNKEDKRGRSKKYKTFIMANPIQLNDKRYKEYSIKTSIFDIKENDKEIEIESNSSKIAKYNKNNINNEEIDKANESSLIIKDIINFERIKKNNYMNIRKNPAYWNNNIKRINTAGNRNHKVINKPLYVTKISDFVKEFNRIKTLSKSAKRRMREKHFTTMDNIDKISQIKEDLLMFILKMKFFHCSFPPKKVKAISKKELFIKNLKNYLDIIDNPYSLATRELKTEIKKNDKSKFQ